MSPEYHKTQSQHGLFEDRSAGIDTARRKHERNGFSRSHHQEASANFWINPPYAEQIFGLTRPAMLSLVILSLGLAMDAVAVSLVRGATGEHRTARAVETAAFFGIAQGLMPLAGWAAGAVLSNAIETIHHWIAFAILVFLGVRMLVAAASRTEHGARPSNRSYYGSLVVAAVATSVDAAAAGITLPLLGQPIGVSCLVIGVITASLCAPAYWLGTIASHSAGKWAEALGGAVLIGLGVNILMENLAL